MYPAHWAVQWAEPLLGSRSPEFILGDIQGHGGLHQREALADDSGFPLPEVPC